MEFVAGDFKHNGRVALVLLPAWFVMLEFGGRTLSSVLSIGMMICWMFDFSDVREGALIVMWLTLAAAGLTVFVSTAMVLSENYWLLCLVGCMELVVMLTGMWGTLQFRWIQHDSPELALVFERMLLSGSPLPAGVVLAWAAVSAQGFGAAPFYLLGALLLGVACVGESPKSSFLISADRACGDGSDTMLLVASLVALPLAVHYALRHAVLFSDEDSLYVALALVCLPIVLTHGLSDRKLFWWTGIEPPSLSRALVVIRAAALTVLLWCFEMRVLFVSYAHLVTLPYAVAKVAVTVALFGGVVTVAAIYTGLIRSRVPLYVLCAGCSTSAGVVMGMPFWMLPAPAAAGLCFAEYQAAKKLLFYLGFSLSASSCTVWFVHRSYSFLHFNFRPGLLGEISISSFSLGVEALVILSLLLPGLIQSGGSIPFTGVVLLCQSVLLAVLEITLMAQGEGMYSPLLLAITAIAALVMSHKLAEQGKLMPGAAICVQAVSCCKLSTLVLDDPYAFLATLALAAVLVPLRSEGGEEVTAERAAAHAAALGAVIYATRGPVLDPLARAIIGEALSEAMLLGATLLAWACCCTPLVAKLPLIQSVRAHRLCALVAAEGVIFLAIDPRVGHGDSLWQSATRALIPTSSGGVGPTVVNSHDGHWTQWVLVVSLSLLAATATRAAAAPNSVAGRVVIALSLGGSLGLYFCGMLLPYDGVLYCLTGTVLVLGICFMLLVKFPTAHSARAVPYVFGAFVTLLPVTYLAQAERFYSRAGWRYHEQFLQHRVALLGLYAVLLVLIAVTVKLEVDGAQRDGGSRGGYAKASRASSSQDLDTLPVVGNAATVLAYGLALFLNLRYLEGTVRSAVALSSLFLLLSRDGLLLREHSERTRYGAVIFVTALTCGTASVVEIMNTIFVERSATAWWIVREHLLLLLLVPTVYMSLQRYASAARARQNAQSCMLVAPLNVLAAVGSDVEGTFVQGCFATLVACRLVHDALNSAERGRQVI